MKAIPTALAGLGIGILIVAVKTYINSGDVTWWHWVLIPTVACGLFLWLGGPVKR